MLLFCLVALPLVVGGLLATVDKVRILFPCALCSTGLVGVAAAVAWGQGTASVTLPLFSDFGITFALTPLGGLYGLLSALLWLVAILTSRTYFSSDAPNLGRYYASLLITLGGVMGVFLAADLFTLFVFFEVMSFTSYLWVAHSQEEEAIFAGESYLAFGVFGGLSILFGLFLLYGLTPDLTIANLTASFAPHVGTIQLTVACLLLFLGFGAKAGAFFLHDWLPLSYVAAPAPASGLLSGILSKAGVYGILLIGVKILSQWEVFALFLLVIALLNMVIGGLCALTTANLKRMLAFSSISQVGFMLWGVALISLLGEAGAIAAYGTLFHMINHSLIKVLLFCLAGMVYTATQTLDLNQLQGFGRGKPWLQTLFLAGMLSVSGIPGLSGYISKTLLHESIVEYMHYHQTAAVFGLVEILFLFAGGCTLAYMLKLYVCLFVEGDLPSPTPGMDRASGAALSLVALSLVALSLVVLGALPHLTFDVLGEGVAASLGVGQLEAVSYFSLTNLAGALCSIAIGLGLFVADRLLSKWREGQQYGEQFAHEASIQHLLYRPAILALSFLGGLFARVWDVLLDVIVFVLGRTAFAPLSIPQSFYHGDDYAIKVERSKVHITFSLAYSLLMFGMGFLFTIISLLVLGGRG